jgi:hypothetical protein
MKKLIAIAAIFATIYTSEAAAQQGGGDPATMMARMKERIKPELVSKTKLTDAQADKVIEINFEFRQQMRELRDLSEADRVKKREEIQENINKKYKEIPLTDDQIKSVNDFYDEWRKNMQQRGPGANG